MLVGNGGCGAGKECRGDRCVKRASSRKDTHGVEKDENLFQLSGGGREWRKTNLGRDYIDRHPRLHKVQLSEPRGTDDGRPAEPSPDLDFATPPLPSRLVRLFAFPSHREITPRPYERMLIPSLPPSIRDGSLRRVSRPNRRSLDRIVRGLYVEQAQRDVSFRSVLMPSGKEGTHASDPSPKMF